MPHAAASRGLPEFWRFFLIYGANRYYGAWMKTLPVAKFRDSVSECIRAAEETGERIAITRHGLVVAFLVPAKACPDLREHPMFGLLQEDPRSPDEILADLRKPRHAV